MTIGRKELRGVFTALVTPMNADGSVDILIGPDEPEGDLARNWIPSEPDRAWFPYFRLYSPTQAFLDQSWVLPDIEKAD